jgi:hypothetical protein
VKLKKLPENFVKMRAVYVLESDYLIAQVTLNDDSKVLYLLNGNTLTMKKVIGDDIYKQMLEYSYNEDKLLAISETGKLVEITKKGVIKDLSELLGDKLAVKMITLGEQYVLIETNSIEPESRIIIIHSTGKKWKKKENEKL